MTGELNLSTDHDFYAISINRITEQPSIHSFRRAFALAMLRAGVDLLTIARLLGHSDLSLLDRYIRQTGEDLRESHEKGSPVDGLL